MQLNGHIKKFDALTGIGVITAENGGSYRFTKQDIVNAAPELIGAEVDFLLDSRRPRAIVVLAGSPWNVFSATQH